MEYSDRPRFTDYEKERIEVEMHRVDKVHWDRIVELRVQSPKGALSTFIPPPSGPKPPRQPIELLLRIQFYAQALFYLEASKYPKRHKHAELRHWLTKLGERTEERAVKQIRSIENSSLMKTLAYHGLEESKMRIGIQEEMGRAVDKFAPTLQQQVDALVSVLKPAKAVTPTPQAKKLEAQVDPVAKRSQERRRVVEPFLEQKGWSILDWANDAGVDHATAMDFLQGKTRPYRSTRLKLAKALGIGVDRLPQ